MKFPPFPPHLKVWIQNSLITRYTGLLKLVYSLHHQYFAGGWVLPSDQGHRLGYEIFYVYFCVYMFTCVMCMYVHVVGGLRQVLSLHLGLFGSMITGGCTAELVGAGVLIPVLFLAQQAHYPVSRLPSPSPPGMKLWKEILAIHFFCSMLNFIIN